jgi:hypothetical protein
MRARKRRWVAAIWGDDRLEVGESKRKFKEEEEWQ